MLSKVVTSVNQDMWQTGVPRKALGLNKSFIHFGNLYFTVQAYTVCPRPPRLREACKGKAWFIEQQNRP